MLEIHSFLEQWDRKDHLLVVRTPGATLEELLVTVLQCVVDTGKSVIGVDAICEPCSFFIFCLCAFIIFSLTSAFHFHQTLL